MLPTMKAVELADLREGRSYAIRYGVDDEEHEFDSCVFDGFWYSDVRKEKWPAFLRPETTPERLLFNPAEIVRITPE